MNMRAQDVRLFRSALPAGVLAVLGFGLLAPGLAQAVEFEYSGYIREHLSINLQNSDEFEPKATTGPTNLLYDESKAGTFGGKGELSMWRHSAKLDAKADFGAFQIAGVGRIARETRTSYERGLQKSSEHYALKVHNGVALTVPTGLGLGQPAYANSAAFNENFLLYPFIQRGLGESGFAGGTTDDLALDEYDTTELRELYVTFGVGDRTHFKLGKQQVVWGETDFFRAMDIIHGYDLRWRSFLEIENEELRKPLIMANVTIDVPELAGALQLIFRPGWDNGDDIGESVPLNGGRWAPAPLGGAGLSNGLFAVVDPHHNLGDENDANYGFRWTGTFKQLGYSFAYYRGLSNDALVQRNPLVGGSTVGQWEGLRYQTGAIVFPMIETYGFTMNAYSGPLDAVLRGELAFTPNKAYNTGTNTYADLFAFVSKANSLTIGSEGPGLLGDFFASAGGGAVLLNDPENLAATAYTPGDIMTGTGFVGAALSVPGVGPVVEKDTLKIMLGVDKQLNWTMNALKTSRPAFWTMQLFDTWVMNYDRDDDIVELFGYGAARREHQTFWTNAFSFPYRYDTITPGLAFGFDLGSFDAFVLPSLDIAMGDHWRLRFEADIFLPRHVEKTNLGETGSEMNDVRLLGTLHDRDQFAMRITYQF